MGILLLVAAIVGIASLLGGALTALSNAAVALLKYVVGPVAILLIILCCMKFGI